MNKIDLGKTIQKRNTNYEMSYEVQPSKIVEISNNNTVEEF